jgi:hypothetical protein
LESKAVPLASPAGLNNTIPTGELRKVDEKAVFCTPFEIGVGSVICIFSWSIPPGGTVSLGMVNSTPTKGASFPRASRLAGASSIRANNERPVTDF